MKENFKQSCLLLGLLIIVCFGFMSFYYCHQSSTPKTIKFISCDSITIEGQITLPTTKSRNKIIIEVNPCLVTAFTPKYTPTNKSINDKVEEKLVEKGCAYFKFIGRKDSIWIYDRQYPVSTMFTKVQDLNAAISFIMSQPDLKNMEIILYGISEGGAVSAISASQNSNVKSIVLISAPGTSGPDFLSYQSKCKDSTFMRSYGLNRLAFNEFNEFSSLDKKVYKPFIPKNKPLTFADTLEYFQSFEDYKDFRKVNYGPLEDLAYKYDNYDTVAYYVMTYLKKKWSLEDEKTKALHKDFKSYCKSHHHYAYIQPEQIALKKWKPELYFPNIKCPVLAVYGTKDENVEYSSSIKNITELLAKGGNKNLTVFALKDHSHYLAPIRSKLPTSFAKQDSCVNNIVEWIMKQ